MQKDEAYYKDLVSGWLDRKISAGELEELLAYIKQEPDAYDRIMQDAGILAALAEKGNSDAAVPDAVSQRVWSRIADTVNEEPIADTAPLPRIPLHRKPWARWAAAAAVLGIVVTTAVFLWQEQPSRQPGAGISSGGAAFDASPGKNVAVLTLGDGSQILLDSATTGEIAKQEGAEVVKTAEGAIAYDDDHAAGSVYNTIATPRGGQFRLRLADGTTVWLNAASSLYFPTTFSGKERIVELTGEAYFEVARNARMPFLVKVNGMEVKVLGTHFNINAYSEEEAVKTTLLEGSVSVGVLSEGAPSPSGTNARPPSVVLKPGQQAVAQTTGALPNIAVVNNASLDQVMAWKNGLFNFNKLSLQEVMRQLSRWYDVDVEYQGKITPTKFGGEMQRDLNLSEVLEGLKDMGVHFKIEGKKLIVIALP